MAMFMFIDCYGHESQLDDNDGQYDDAILTEVLQEDITVGREIERERDLRRVPLPRLSLCMCLACFSAWWLSRAHYPWLSVSVECVVCPFEWVRSLVICLSANMSNYLLNDSYC